MLKAEEFRTVLAGSPLQNLSLAAIEQMLRQHHVMSVPLGAAVYIEMDDPKLLLVLEGSGSTALTSARGRQMTIRYVKVGDFVGLPTILAGPSPVRFTATAATRLCVFNPAMVQAAAQTDVKIAWALAQECAYHVFELLEQMEQIAFGTIREKVCRHLLNMAREDAHGLVAHCSMQELAQAIGSVREVVGRCLVTLRSEGLIETGHRTIRILDASGLCGSTHAAGRDAAADYAPPGRPRGTA